MMNGLIFALTANGNSFLDNAKQAGTVTLVGMCAIFGVLALLWGIIEIMHRAMVGSSKKNNAPLKTQDELSGAVTPGAPVTPVKAASAGSTGADDGALIAVITAAVAAAMADEGYTGGFRVVSFKRASARRSGRA